MAGKHESIEKLIADLEQRNAVAREAGAGQDMTVDVVVRPCEVAQTIQDMVTKSRPRNLIAPAPSLGSQTAPTLPTLPTISPPLPQEEEEEEKIPEPEPEPEHIPEPEPTVIQAPPPAPAPAPAPEVAERPHVMGPVDDSAHASGPSSSLRRAEGTGKEIMLQVCIYTLQYAVQLYSLWGASNHNSTSDLLCFFHCF